MFQSINFPKLNFNRSWFETTTITVLALSFSITASLYAVDAATPAVKPNPAQSSSALVPLNAAQGVQAPANITLPPPATGQMMADHAAVQNSEPTSDATATTRAATTQDGEKLVAENTTDAKRIAELQETIAEQSRRIAELKEILESPESEYASAEASFRDLKQQWERLRELLERALQEGNRNAAGQLQVDLEALTKQLQLAQERFDLAIEERKNAREEWITLQAKLKKDVEALQSLTGEDVAAETSKEAAADDKSNGEEMKQRADDAEKASQEHTGSTDRKDGEADKDASEKGEKSDQEADEEMEEDEELTEAKEEAEAKEEEAEQAEEDTQSLAGRISDLQKLISQQQKEIALARKKFDLEVSTQATLRPELERLQLAGGEEAITVMGEIEASEERQRSAKLQINEINERMNDLRSELGMLQSEHIIALQEAAAIRAEAEAARDNVAALQNPFAPRNMLSWLINHGPNLFFIICGMFLFNRIASLFAHRSIRLVSSGTVRGNTAERENRAKTLVGVFQNAATVAIFVSGCLMMLEEVGANVKVLMGGVAVVGLAVAFGAQNLIKDYFYGFVMLLENQYMLNDSVKIGEVSGQVERITLRMTVLRDANGVVHFIPNGTINSVSNETHGWSRAVIQFAVNYEEDLAQVNEIVVDIAEELRREAPYQTLILEHASEISIESFNDSMVQLKFSLKTGANKHSIVKNEFMKRLKRRMSESGIAPPYPQQVYQVRGDSLPNEAFSQNRKTA